MCKWFNNPNRKTSIANDGKVGINLTPETGGGLVQLRNTMGYQSQTTNLEESGSMALLRLRMSSDSSKSLFFGGVDESATPYLQVGNKSTNGPNAVYPMLLAPYGGQVGINTTVVGSGDDYATVHIGGSHASNMTTVGGGNMFIGNSMSSGAKNPKDCQLTLGAVHNNQI